MTANDEWVTKSVVPVAPGIAVGGDQPVVRLLVQRLGSVRPQRSICISR
jgi:hypothetical protein